MKIVVIGDAHMPWMHKPTFSKILSIVDSFKPDVIVQIGDLLDMFSFSRFPKKQLISAEDEVLEGRRMADEFWRLLRKSAPKSQCYQIKGNHCDRPIKKTTEVAPELLLFVKPAIYQLYEFDGVKTIHDSTSELIIEDMCFMHGYRSKLGDHCKHNMMKTIVGHSHRGGVVFHPTIHGKQIWELNCGYIADPESDALKYSQQKYSLWTKGVGLIDGFGPRFIPL